MSKLIQKMFPPRRQKSKAPSPETALTLAAPATKLKPVNNQFTKLLSVTKYLPAGARANILSKAFGKVVPFVGTAGVYYEQVEPNQVVVSLDNTKAVQNHIGSVHAVAVTLLAETASGFILALNLPSDRILLIKSYSVNFYRPLKKGQVAAIASLSDEARLEILNTPKGEMVVPCVIKDRESDSNRDSITVEMTWAWIPKSELESRRGGNATANDNHSTVTNIKAEDNHNALNDNKKANAKKDEDNSADDSLIA